MTAAELIAFEDDISECYKNKMIRAPIHLYNGNENEMLEVFKTIKPDDWVFCSWRSHYQCLLKGVPPTELKQAILDGKSISLCFPKYRIVSSAIVTGVLPIAVGTALAIKRSGGSEKVHCFVGDMTSETGCFSECLKYSVAYSLPIRFIVEDNGKSVCSDTRAVWNAKTLFAETTTKMNVLKDYLHYYKYESKYPHAGISNQRITF